MASPVARAVRPQHLQQQRAPATSRNAVRTCAPRARRMAVRASVVYSSPASQAAPSVQAAPARVAELAASYNDFSGAILENKSEGCTGTRYECADYNLKNLDVSKTVAQNEGGSWVRSDGEILIPANYQDFKTWALDPTMSGDDQIIILAAASILAAQGKKTLGISERVSGVIFGALKAGPGYERNALAACLHVACSRPLRDASNACCCGWRGRWCVNVQVVSVVWVSLYWCEACRDIINGV